MELEFDPKKNAWNVAERGLSFERVTEFGLAEAVVIRTERGGEERRVAYGYLDGRLHVLCYTPRGDKIRVISFRKANEQEAMRYGLPLRSDGR